MKTIQNMNIVIQIIITDNRLYGQQLIRTRPVIHRNIRLYLQETHRLVLQVQVMINQQQTHLWQGIHITGTKQ